MTMGPVPEAQTRAWPLTCAVTALSHDLVLVIGHIDRALTLLGQSPLKRTDLGDACTELCRARDLLILFPSVPRQSLGSNAKVRGGIDGDYHHDDTIQDREERWHHDPFEEDARHLRDSRD